MCIQLYNCKKEINLFLIFFSEKRFQYKTCHFKHLFFLFGKRSVTISTLFETNSSNIFDAASAADDPSNDRRSNKVEWQWRPSCIHICREFPICTYLGGKSIMAVAKKRQLKT